MYKNILKNKIYFSMLNEWTLISNQIFTLSGITDLTNYL